MTILALEFSSARRSVALAREGVVLAEAEATGGRATHAFALIEQVLASAGIQREEVTTLAVGVGPGSYTGIRAAIAMAQGWQLARGVRLVPVSSVEALAARARTQKLFGRIHLVVDAQRGEFYLATWEISANQCQEITPLKIIPANELEQLARAGGILAGPAIGKTEEGLFPSAAEVARLAWGRRDLTSPNELAPIYLRETSFVKAAGFRI